MLQAVGGDERLSAADAEHNLAPSRLELLAVVRGLEALDRPAQVTLAHSQPLRKPRHPPPAQPMARSTMAVGTFRQRRADSRPRPLAAH